jgi:hypothetical protein
MPHAITSARRRRGALTLAAALAVALAATTAGASQLTLTPDREVGVWNQPFGFELRGVGCQPSFRFIDPPNPQTTAMLVTDSCAAGETPAPFVLRGTLVGRPLGLDTMTASDLASSDSQDFTLYGASTILVEPAQATSSDPQPLHLTLQGGCNSLDFDVAGTRITVHLGGCLFEPFGVHTATIDVPVGPLAPGNYDVRVFDDRGSLSPTLALGTLVVRAPASCFAADDRLCLQGGRFSVTGNWQAFDATTGQAHAKPLQANEESGLLWFFDADNTEASVKVLPGCSVNGHWWVYLSSSSTVQYAITVTDTTTGQSRVYTNALGHPPSLVADVAAFEACP